jgi:hypothetical protein
MIFAAAPQKVLSVALKVGIGLLGDIPARPLSIGRRSQVFYAGPIRSRDNVRLN